MKKLLVCLLVLVMLAGNFLSVAAQDGNVVYSGDAGHFIFTPGSEYSPTDLFPEFKNVMPGDTLRQNILVRNDASNKVKIKIYMRALGAHEGSEEFLSQLNLYVEKKTDTVLFDATAEKTAQLTDWVCLGTLYSGGEAELTVLLDVPETLDNRFKNLVGYLDWEFMVEEYPIESTDPVAPTGDETNLELYIAVMAVSAAAILLLVILLVRKKKNQDD